MPRSTLTPVFKCINDAFPRKVCINLNKRQDRWRQMQFKLSQLGIKSVQRFPAIDGNDHDVPSGWTHTTGALGCLLSHLEVVRDARRLGQPDVLIFEDDVVFDEHFNLKFGDRLKQLPADWDMLYFGALHKGEPVSVSKNIVRLTRSNSTYAYAIRDTVFDEFIELNAKAETVLDNNSFVLQERFNCYCFMPHLAWVETDYSDAQQKLERHWYIKESLVLFGPRADRLLGDTTIVFAHDARAQGRAIENLLYLVDYYHEFFSPHIAIVIVEQGPRRSVDPTALPQSSEYMLLQDKGPFNRERCFQAGISESRAQRRLAVLSDSDIYLETLDFRANLMMCAQYGAATGAGETIALNAEDSLRLRETGTTRGIDITKILSAADKTQMPGCRFVNRGAVSAHPRQTGSLIASKGADRVFQSPNYALRLSHD